MYLYYCNKNTWDFVVYKEQKWISHSSGSWKPKIQALAFGTWQGSSCWKNKTGNGPTPLTFTQQSQGARRGFLSCSPCIRHHPSDDKVLIIFPKTAPLKVTTVRIVNLEGPADHSKHKLQWAFKQLGKESSIYG